MNIEIQMMSFRLIPHTRPELAGFWREEGMVAGFNGGFPARMEASQAASAGQGRRGRRLLPCLAVTPPPCCRTSPGMSSNSSSNRAHSDRKKTCDEEEEEGGKGREEERADDSGRVLLRNGEVQA